MKVFVSSVRKGLEEERDALPAFLRAIEHEPVMFEQFTAQPVPSRQACLDAVDKAECYLLLLGDHYGEVLPESNRSATHEEYVAARAKGIPRLVMRKKGATFDDRQSNFVREVENYATGLFRREFGSTHELQTEVATALSQLATTPSPLHWSNLESPLAFEWTPLNEAHLQHTRGAVLEVHVRSESSPTCSERQLREIATSIPARLRATDVVSQSCSLQPQSFPDHVSVVIERPERFRTWDEVYDAELIGVRCNRLAQFSVWYRLASDKMGSIIDVEDLTDKIAESLRLIGATVDLQGDRFGIAVGLSNNLTSTTGRVSQLGPRNSASMRTGEDSVRVEPDELVTRAAFDVGATEVGRHLATTLVDRFGARGR